MYSTDIRQVITVRGEVAKRSKLWGELAHKERERKGGVSEPFFSRSEMLDVSGK